LEIITTKKTAAFIGAVFYFTDIKPCQCRTFVLKITILFRKGGIMSKLPSRPITVMAFVATTLFISQIIFRQFRQWDTLDQSIGAVIIMILCGIFFGLWYPRPIRIVVRHGLRHIKIVGLLIPWVGLLVVLLSPFGSDQGALCTPLAALVVATLGATAFWILAIPLGAISSRLGIYQGKSGRMLGGFLKRHGMG
jgi:hypothetical protein